MKRRDFLTVAGGIMAGMVSGQGFAEFGNTAPRHFGWVPSKRETAKFKARERQPYFAQQAKSLAGTGRGKRSFLWKYMEAVTGGPIVPHVQTVGDCVSQEYGLGIDILNCVQIAHGRGAWRGKAATEIIYAGARVEVGAGSIRGDGCHGSWAATWCRDFGILLRQPYLDGKYDFTTYSGSKARKWAHICGNCTEWGGGVPNELEPLCMEHSLKTATLATSWEQVRDSVCNGYPVVLCAKQGFKTTRDSDGVLPPRWSDPWNHATLVIGVDDTTDRPIGILANSWGEDWIDGPPIHEQPAGSFAADADIIDRMASQEDSYALSNYVGYPRQHLDYQMY